MGYHLISVEPLVKLTGLDGPVVRLLTGIFIAYPLALLYGFVLYKKNPCVQTFPWSACPWYPLPEANLVPSAFVEYFIPSLKRTQTPISYYFLLINFAQLISFQFSMVKEFVFDLQFLFKEYLVFPCYDIRKHILLTMCGLCLAVFLYGLEGLHSLVAVVVQYLLIHQVGPNHVMILASFIFQMTYLVVGYWKYSTDLYDIAWTTAQCILVLRLLGVAWDTYDGAQDLEKASNDTKEMALRTLPGFLEMTGHAYFFGSFVVGPQFPMSRYLSFIKGTLIPPEHDRHDVKIKRGLLRLSAGIVYLLFYALIDSSLSNAYLVSKEFEAQPLFKKFVHIAVWGKAGLSKYMGVWLIAEGSCIMTGLTYNGKTEAGVARWDALKNAKITIHETATTLQGVIDSFNVNTNMWMSRYVFKRLRFLGNKTLSHVITLMFLAIWHGVYIGYFICFMSEYFYITAERQLLTFLGRFEERINPTGMIFKIRWLMMYVLRNVVMSYCLLPFVLLTWSRIFKVYYATYALPHFIVFTWIIFYEFLYLPLFTKESRKKRE